MLGHFLVFQRVHTPVILCAFLSCVVCQLKTDSFVRVPFWGGHIGFFHDFESKFQNLSFDYFSCK